MKLLRVARMTSIPGTQFLHRPGHQRGQRMKRTHFSLWGSFLVFAALLHGPSPALAQTAPPLGVVQQFSVLGNSGVTGSVGAGTAVNGDVGSSPTASITNFPPSSVTPPFALHLTNDLVVQQAHADAVTAYSSLAAQGPGTVLAAQLNGAVLTSGIYSFTGGAADLAAGGTLTLNGPGVFVFQVNTTLTANVGSNVAGTASPCNVYWRVGTSATLNGSSFRGTVIANANITVGSGSNVSGRTIAGTGVTGAVTLAGAGGNTIGGCASVVVAVDTRPPAATQLGPASPNPFNRVTTLSYALANRGRVDLVVYGVDGRRIRTLVSEVREAGVYQCDWNGLDDAGRAQHAGVYFVRMNAADSGQTRALVLR